MSGDPGLDVIAERLYAGHTLLAQPVDIAVGGLGIRLRSNSAELLARMRDYFAGWLVELERPDVVVEAVEQAAPDLGITFVDWRREPGKTGRKDSYHDLSGARLVRKVRTGMVFLQSAGRRIAAGPCLANDNQVINFVNAQYMNSLQQEGWLICHAAALARNDRALAIAGFSGGGKSTLMLQALEHPDTAFMTNDRLFLKSLDGGIEARGIAKLPRVNPGTVVNNPRLQALIPAARRDQLRDLPADELWELEEKHDVMIDELFGPGRIVQSAPLSGLLILDWQRDTDEPTRFDVVDPGEQARLLGALMKSPGPFYQYADGRFFSDRDTLNPVPYLELLRGIPVYAASGPIDFAQATTKILQIME